MSEEKPKVVTPTDEEVAEQADAYAAAFVKNLNRQADGDSGEDTEEEAEA